MQDLDSYQQHHLVSWCVITSPAINILDSDKHAGGIGLMRDIEYLDFPSSSLLLLVNYAVQLYSSKLCLNTFNQWNWYNLPVKDCIINGTSFLLGK